MSTKPFGHEAAVARRKPGTGAIGDREVIHIHRVGSLATIERAAKLVSGFIEVEQITPFQTRDAYVRVFGWGKS